VPSELGDVPVRVLVALIQALRIAMLRQTMTDRVGAGECDSPLAAADELPVRVAVLEVIFEKLATVVVVRLLAPILLPVSVEVAFDYRAEQEVVAVVDQPRGRCGYLDRLVVDLNGIVSRN